MVRNEAAFLDACLQSLDGQIDSIYVTDTGSTDDSITVARSHNAVIRSFPWCNDFARARNASIAEVAEDWIITLDADDLFPPGEAARLRTHLEANACAATVRYAVQSGYTSVRAWKILRNRRGAHFEGAIHESLSTWLTECRRAGLPLQDTDIQLVHTGYVPQALPGKVARNLPLLESAWNRTGLSAVERRFQIGADLGLALALDNRPAEACVFLENLLGELASVKVPTSPSPAAVKVPTSPSPAASLQALINLLWILSERKDAAAALAWTRKLEQILGSSPVYELHRGLSEFASGYFAAAIQWLQRFAQSRHPDTFEVPVREEYLGVGLWRIVGQCHMSLHQYEEAAECFNRCSRLEPGNPEHELRHFVARRIMRE
jgi:tetratricopeptide (TPR) repeat protein